MSPSPLSDPNFPPNLAIQPSSNPSPLLTDGLSLDLANFGFLAQESAIRKYGIAGRVWEAAYAMTRYVHPPPNLIFDPPFIDASTSAHAQNVSIIELGSGTGLVASSIAGSLQPGRDRLIVTDLPEVCSLLELNLQSIKLGFETHSLDQNTLVIRPLSWGNREDATALASEFFDTAEREHGFLTHIICSDLVYFPELLAPLLRSLLHLSSPPFIQKPASASPVCGPSILISYKIRSLAKETPFWSAFGLWFDFGPVLVKDNLIDSEAEWRRFGASFEDPTFLFIGHRRTESLNWTVPTNDAELLQGVGANGTDHRKGDDTFENLLLMSLERD